MKPKPILLVISLLSSICLSLLAPTSAHAASLIRVTPTGSTTWPCGAAWASACELQTALAHAASGDQIWVATGTYKPTTGTSRGATFQLKSGVALYGGFAATETALEQRDWTLNVTTLSGDIGCLGANHDNVYHVVIGANSATLDGFTVTGGNAGDPVNPAPTNDGGGLYNLNSSPTLTHVIFQDNNAVGLGGGMYNKNSHPILTYVTFS